jgi:hypothetical protein
MDIYLPSYEPVGVFSCHFSCRSAENVVLHLVLVLEAVSHRSQFANAGGRLTMGNDKSTSRV